MKILAVISYYPPHINGGYEIRCSEVISSLRKRGHEVIVITSRCADSRCDLHLRENGILRKLHLQIDASNLISQMLFDYEDANFLTRIINTFLPDVIYVWHIESLSNAILPFFSRTGIKIIIDEGSSELIYLNKLPRPELYFAKNMKESKLKNWLKNGILLFAERITAHKFITKWQWPSNLSAYFNSQYGKEVTMKEGVQLGFTAVIHSGIDTSKFYMLKNRNLAYPINILIPGRIYPQKGTIDAIHLLRELLERNIQANLILIGNVQSYSYYLEILNQMNLFNLATNVEYKTMVPQNELVHYYQNSDFCFFPSYHKTGLSRTPLEAMASGCVVISYGNEGSKEIIQDNETGFIIPEGNILKAATLISNLIDKPEIYKNIRMNARLQIEQEYTLDKYIDKIEKFLCDSLKS